MARNRHYRRCTSSHPSTQGDLPAALAAYDASLAIRKRLAEADPGNAEWQRDLIVSHGKLAEWFSEQPGDAGRVD
jgi:hypothetical protein